MFLFSNGCLLSFEQELTIRSVNDVEEFPLLESFHWEIRRMFPVPPFYVKVTPPRRLDLEVIVEEVLT